MKTVSPFELAIAQIADPEAAKTMRAETAQEKQSRIHAEIKSFVKMIKIKPAMSVNPK